MPICLIWTNLGKVPSSFLGKTTRLLAELTKKPEDRVMCIAQSGQSMRYGNSDQPCVFVTMSSIGVIDPVSNKKYSASLCDHVSKELGIQRDRILIKFQNLQGSDVGWNGTTRE